MHIHHAATVSTEQQTAQGIGLAPAIRIAPDVLAEALHVIEGGLIHDGLMRILNDRPLILIHVMAFLVLEVLSGLEVAGMPQIHRILDDVNDGAGSPVIWVLDLSGFP